MNDLSNPTIADSTYSYCTYDKLYPEYDPKTLTPRLSDIVRTLPKINRFNGNTTVPYSVAAHSVMCMKAAQNVYGIKKKHMLLGVLLHDAGETYTGDIVRPIKHKYCNNLSSIDEGLFERILDLFEMEEFFRYELRQKPFKSVLAELDLRMAVSEADLLTQTKILPDVPRLKLRQTQLIDNWREAEYQFKQALAYCCNGVQAPKVKE